MVICKDHRTYAGRLLDCSGNCSDYNRNDSWRFWVTSKLSFSKRFEETESFFRRKDDYLKHSVDLVNEIPKWLDLRNFDECYYGDYGIRFDNRIEDYRHYEVPYLDHLKIHLESAYPDITNFHNSIKKNHEAWSQKIKEIMSDRNISYKPSFEKFICDRIRSSCPELNASNDTELTQNNTYIVRYIFNILFKALYNRLELNPLDVKREGSVY
jgi:hypothetical protein